MKKNKNVIQDFDDEEELMNFEDSSLDDDQYLEMLRGDQKPKKNPTYDFTQNPKYKGEKRTRKFSPGEGSDEEITLDEEDNVVELKEQQKLRQPTKKVKKVKLMSMDDELREIEKDDADLIRQNEQNAKELKATAEALQEQLSLWKRLSVHRSNQQRILENMKRLPGPNEDFLSHFDNPNLFNQIIESLVVDVQTLLETRQQLYEFPESTKIELPHNLNGPLIPNVEELGDFCWNRLDQKKDDIQEDIIKWSQKTLIIQKKQGLTGSLNFGSLISTPIGQTQKALLNKVQFIQTIHGKQDKLIQKSRLKRSIYRMLGQSADDLGTSSSSLIFDDTDFYLELLKEITQQTEDGTSDMLTNSTQQYILQRQIQNQERNHKDVDRRASKARKLRFDQHQKIINFMVPIDNCNEIEARDDIVVNLFGNKLFAPAKAPKTKKKKAPLKKKITKQDEGDVEYF